jgi:hypothetical protein
MPLSILRTSIRACVPEARGLPGAIENMQFVAVLLKMPGHGRPHNPRADPADSRTLILLSCPERVFPSKPDTTGLQETVLSPILLIRSPAGSSRCCPRRGTAEPR